MSLATPKIEDPTGVVRKLQLTDTATRELVRRMRRPPEHGHMPDSELWGAYLELSRRGEPQAARLFLSGLKSLHRRRAIGTGDLSQADPDPAEHRGAEDPYVGELWKAYKRCISDGRTGPAAQLLRDLEETLLLTAS